MRLAVVVIVALVILLALALIWALLLRSNLARANRALQGLEDPKSWLSDEDRRQYALELLERERVQYQDSLTEKRLDQVKQFNPTRKEGNL